MATRIDYIGLAGDIKAFINNSTVKFADDNLRIKLFSANDSDFLRIVKTIGSNTMIISIDIVDDAFVRRAVLGE